MTLLQLRYAIAVADSQSINEAANRLFVSQPTLSYALSQLEDELGFEIFTRTNKGVIVTSEGYQFLGYARQVCEQQDLLEEKYLKKPKSKQRFGVSCHHYAFAVSSFVDLLRTNRLDEYELTIKETKTYEIIEDVTLGVSELGIIYLSKYNRSVIMKLLKDRNLEWTGLFESVPHIFIQKNHPLAGKEYVTLPELDPYPCLTFSQGQYNSFHFSEEVLSSVQHKKNIVVTDRATIFNLMKGLDGYTISTGILSKELDDSHIISVPLKCDEKMEIGYISRKRERFSKLAVQYITMLETFAAEQIELSKKI